jgi:hypothetical protein
MSFVRITGHPGIHESAPHDGGDLVDEGMLNAAVRNVHDAMSIEFEQSQFGRPQPAADGEARAQPKSGSAAGYHRNVGQPMSAGQRIERAPRHGGDAGFTETRAARTRRPMRTRGCCAHRPLGPLENQAILVFLAFFILPFIGIPQRHAVSGNRLKFALDYFPVFGP